MADSWDSFRYYGRSWARQLFDPTVALLATLTGALHRGGTPAPSPKLLPARGRLQKFMEACWTRFSSISVFVSLMMGFEIFCIRSSLSVRHDVSSEDSVISLFSKKTKVWSDAKQISKTKLHWHLVATLCLEVWRPLAKSTNAALHWLFHETGKISSKLKIFPLFRCVRYHLPPPCPLSVRERVKNLNGKSLVRLTERVDPPSPLIRSDKKKWVFKRPKI